MVPIRQVQIHSRDYINPTLLSPCSINNHNEPNKSTKESKTYIHRSSDIDSLDIIIFIFIFIHISFLLLFLFTSKKNYDHYIPIQRTQPNTIKEIYEKTLSSVMRILIKVAPTGVPRGADSHLSRGCRTGC